MELIFFDEIDVPSRIEGPSQTIDQEEMIDFARVWDPLPIHLDDDFAREFGGLLHLGHICWHSVSV